MKVIQVMIGALLIACGIVGALYVGVALLLVGGITELVNGVKATPADVGAIVWGILKITPLAELCGGAVFIAGAGLGGLFLKTAGEARYEAAVRDIGRDRHPTGRTVGRLR